MPTDLTQEPTRHDCHMNDFSYFEVFWFLKLFGSLMSKFPGFLMFLKCFASNCRLDRWKMVKRGQGVSGCFREVSTFDLELCFSPFLSGPTVLPKLFDALLILYWCFLNPFRYSLLTYSEINIIFMFWIFLRGGFGKPVSQFTSGTSTLS